MNRWLPTVSYPMTLCLITHHLVGLIGRWAMPPALVPVRHGTTQLEMRPLLLQCSIPVLITPTPTLKTIFGLIKQNSMDNPLLMMTIPMVQHRAFLLTCIAMIFAALPILVAMSIPTHKMLAIFHTAQPFLLLLLDAATTKNITLAFHGELKF